MYKNALLSNPTLEIKAGSSALAKHAAFQYLYGGVLKIKAAADLPALSGVLTTAYSRVYFFYINAAGTVTVDVSDQVLTTDDLKINELRNNELSLRDAGGLLIGWLVVRNATGSDFTGGTTALDVGSLTTYYHSAFGLNKQEEVI